MIFYQKNFLTIALMLVVFVMYGQKTLVINELDCDTPGIDDKEFVEIKSETANFALDGYVVVFFNGSANGGNTSYLALDLDGYTTDVNGILLIGSTTVVPFPQYIIPNNVIQNGADAVAIYKADAEDFTDGIVAYVDATLIDVLIYGTSDPDAVTLIDIFKAFDPNITQINEGSSNNTNSIQRNNDGTYFSGTPTPRKLNDGTGIQLNGLLATFSQSMFTEGETIEIVFTTEENVLEDLPVVFTLDYGTFNQSDYNGINNITISKGQNMAKSTIQIIDDVLDEGDEEILLKILDLPVAYLSLNNNVKIRIIDNDFKVAGFGKPTSPTFGNVTSTQPADYYKNLLGKSGTALRQALQDIISNPNIVRAQTYNDVTDILKEADQNPENSNQVWLVYLEKGRPKLDFQLSSNNLNTWNREHTWPRSRGGFNSIEADETINGKDIFWITGADSTRHANSDAHAIRAVDGPENSSRGNQFYGEYNGPVGTSGSFKGDVARGVFYLDIRYNGLELVNGFPEGQVGKFGDLETLMQWHQSDPADDFEMNRNNVVFDWQKNRNPFIDLPDLADYIFGDKKDQIWNGSSNIQTTAVEGIILMPNPSNGYLNIEGVRNDSTIKIYSTDGRCVKMIQSFSDIGSQNFDLPDGTYIVQIISGNRVTSKRWIVRH